MVVSSPKGQISVRDSRFIRIYGTYLKGVKTIKIIKITSNIDDDSTAGFVVQSRCF